MKFSLNSFQIPFPASMESLRRNVEIPIPLSPSKEGLANRKITFGLGFRWNGPVAFNPNRIESRE